ncbi:subunit of RNA polymerase III transcription factor [Golovinomyces cichoracearum]|uniref:Subunit of RNA polymerase III transcription factor n=1 Tax=Golovinomyces cichoracearum TaxID=62708 RepID=A0A420J5P9_9PEZI|nr:subunit of RNA polymerase III transcription factor [Golovinomyces cichoracearum]
MLKGRSKTFVPKKIIRNAPCNQRAPKKNDEATANKQEPNLREGDSVASVLPNEYVISTEIAVIDVQKEITTPLDTNGGQDTRGDMLSAKLHELNSKQRHPDPDLSKDLGSIPNYDNQRGVLTSANYPTPPTTQINNRNLEENNSQVLIEKIYEKPGLNDAFLTHELNFPFGDISQVSYPCPEQSGRNELSVASIKEADLSSSKTVSKISNHLISNAEKNEIFSPSQEHPNGMEIHKFRSSQVEKNQYDNVRIDPSIVSDGIAVEPEILQSISSVNHLVGNEKETSQLSTNDENEESHNDFRPKVCLAANYSRDIPESVLNTPNKPTVQQQKVDHKNCPKENQPASKDSLLIMHMPGPSQLSLNPDAGSFETPADTTLLDAHETAENASDNNMSAVQARLPTVIPSISENLESAPRKKRKYVKRSRAVESDPVVDTLPDISVGRKVRKTSRRKRMKRENTPEGAEAKKIDPSVITMQDLCRDLRIGKKSKNHDEIMGRLARVKRNAVQSKMRREHPELSEFLSEEDNCVKNSNESGNTATCIEAKSMSSPPRPATGLRMRIVDGQIVTDEQSLQIDRHKRARENAGDEENIIEENDFTRIVTCSDYMKRERAHHWDLSANELFWKGLRMFGTDFEMIANMFPNRSRRQIKLKFNAEERCNPQKLNRVLMGIKTEAIDLDEFQRLGNLELEDLAVINAEQAEIDKEQADQLEAIERVRQSEESRKKSEIRGDLSAKNRKDTARLNKSRKKMQSIYGGGEEVIVLETI